MIKHFEAAKAAIDNGSMSDGKRTVTVELQELEDADVRYISLVRAGANRVPYRIMKSEDNAMLGLDLGQIFKRKDEEEVTDNNVEPRIAAILINESDYADDLIVAIKTQGFEFDTVDTDSVEGSRLIKLEEFNDESVVFKLNNDIAIVLAGVAQKSVTPETDSKFANIISQMQFVPGVDMASHALLETMFNAMLESENKEALKSEVEGAIGEFSNFVMGLVDTIPTVALKIEGTYAGSDIQSKVRARQAQVQQDFGATQSATSNERNEGALPGGKGVAGTQVHTGRAQKDETEGQGGDGDDETPDAAVQKGNDDLLGMDNVKMDQLLAGISANFNESNQALREDILKSLNETVGTVRKEFDAKLEELTGKVSKAEQEASELEEAVKGSIVSTSLDDDQLGIQTGHEEKKQARIAVNKRYAEQTTDAPGIFEDAFSFPGLDD